MKFNMFKIFTLTLFFTVPGLAEQPFWEGENLVYQIQGKEASDMFSSFTQGSGAFENESGDRIMVRMEYGQASAANIRIRTKITCFKARPVCRIGVSHLTFIPYPSR